MKSNKLLFAFSSLAVLALTSCNSVSYTHTKSFENNVYTADLNHDGVIAQFTLDDGTKVDEENLTWDESYGTLIDEANSMEDLNKIADKLHIAKDEPKRCSLARYEILHEAEELLMSTGAVTPIYNYGDPYLLKSNIGGIYTVNLGYKYMDRLYERGKEGIGLDNVVMSAGTKAETFDPASNSDASTALIMNQFLIGAKRYERDEKPEEGKDGIYGAHLTDGVATTIKKIITFDKTLKDHTENYFYVEDDKVGNDLKKKLPDIAAELKDSSNGGTLSFDEIKAKYEGTARYTITMNDNAKWNDGSDITASDFVYAWNRSTSGTYNNMPFGMWCDLFNMIRGFDVWNTIGQQPDLNFEQFQFNKSYESSYEYKTNCFVNKIVTYGDDWYKLNKDYPANDVSTIAEAMDKDHRYLSKISETDRLYYQQVWDGIKSNNGDFKVNNRGCAGGMAGVLPNVCYKENADGEPSYETENGSDKSFTVQLINDCDYFESMLAFSAFMPVDKDIVLPQSKDETFDETNEIGQEDKDWWLNVNDKYHTNGPFKIVGTINNYEGGDGGVKLTMSDKYYETRNADTTEATKNLTFKFIDKDTTMLSEFRNDNLQFINNFPNIAIDELRKTKDWQVAEQIGMFFYSFNVNDNTFDTYQQGESQDEKLKGERIRESLRNIFALLMNRYDLAVNVAKKGTPANGFVSDGVVETCQPVWNEEKEAYYAKRDGKGLLDGELVPANWHERNGDTLNALRNAKTASTEETRGDYITKSAMDNRKSTMKDEDGTDITNSGGFLKGDPERIGKDLSEDQVQKANLEEAVEIIKNIIQKYDIPGVSFDTRTNKFTKFPTIKISTNNGSALEDLAERIQYFYKTWGIKITIQTMEWQSFTASRRKGDFAWAREGWVADYNDPRTYLDLCTSGNGNNDTQLGKDSWHRSK